MTICEFDSPGSSMGTTNTSLSVSIQKVMDMLDKKIEITTEDNRIFSGVFKCLDYNMDVLLTECIESYTLPNDPETSIITNIGIVNIPGRFIKTAIKI